ncbi:hypothetical protein [Novosphingobium sp. TCA1]|jgi:hypothetical protein|uniref:hypothetical protein n=1 Tax=Novosphingobium sp. TCA1 TaxID=2682474 RepID=UPI00130AC5FC|nr:hypothetical protein [Novosphingobium sp. TCA1]GFE72380.1 hypothetical protein NTCA1_00290 [Novosphingobium sp. TCA1]
MSEAGSRLSDLERSVGLPLRVLGGRVFLETPTSDNLNGSAVELKCSLTGFTELFHTSIVIGDEKHLALPLFNGDEEQDREEEVGWRLSSCAIMVSFRPIDEAALAEMAEKNDGKPIVGRLNYWKPINSGDGVVNDKWPTVTIWVGVGRDNFALLSDAVRRNDLRGVEVGLSIEFPEGSVTSRMVGRKISWNGEGQLPVTSAGIVWKSGDWSSETDSFQLSKPEKRRIEREPSPEHIETMRGINGVREVLNKLMTPVWIAAIAAAVSIFLRG